MYLRNGPPNPSTNPGTSIWVTVVRPCLLVAILVLALTGCASQLKQQYVRTDGASVDNPDMQAAPGQCKGEAANSNLKPNRNAGTHCQRLHGSQWLHSSAIAISAEGGRVRPLDCGPRQAVRRLKEEDWSG